MDHEAGRSQAAQQRSGGMKGARAGLWIGLATAIATGVMATAWIAARQPKERRAADRGEERRNPMHFFLAGNHPHRRAIDRSGQRPLFERRQSVYDSY